MSDEFEIVDDDATLAIDEEEDFDAMEEGEPGDIVGDEALEEDAPVRPPKFRPDSNVYTIMLVLSCVAYGLALYFVLTEMQTYCDKNAFMFGLFKSP